MRNFLLGFLAAVALILILLLLPWERDEDQPEHIPAEIESVSLVL